MLEIKACFIQLNYSSGTDISREGRTGSYRSGALQAKKFICPIALRILYIMHCMRFVWQNSEHKGVKMPEGHPMPDRASASQLQEGLVTVQSQASQQRL